MTDEFISVILPKVDPGEMAAIDTLRKRDATRHEWHGKYQILNPHG
jgi:hypothetical protein